METTNFSKRFKKWEVVGAIAVSLLAMLFHFLFAFSGHNTAVGMISAVNESVWEHTKIIYFPFLFFSILEYLFLKPDWKRFFAAKTVSLAFSASVMIAFFYTYTGALGAESLIVDIICTFVWIFLAFLISYRLYFSAYRLERYIALFIILFVAQLLMELLFTPFAPHVPLFMDSETGLFGFPPL